MMKTAIEIKDEIALATIGRDCFRAIRCARNPLNKRVAKLATDEEVEFDRRIEKLNAELAKLKS